MDFSDDEVMDPFEIRNLFTDMISKLTSSQQSVTNAAMFAMQHKKSYELCYEILINEIKKQPIPARLNIFHVLDCICRNCLKFNFRGYIELLKDDLTSIIFDIAPENNPKGDANVKNVRKALRGWRDKHFFEDETQLIIIYDQLLKREQRYDEKHKAKQKVKNEVTKRIEEDRVKQKKRKENAWILTSEMDEFSYYWDNLPPYSSLDCNDIITENKIFYHNNYPDITNEQILRVFDRKEIEEKLISKPIVYNKKSNEEEKDSYYQQGRNYDSHNSPRKRTRTEKDRESYDYNDDQYKNKNNKDYESDHKHDRDSKYNKNDKNDKYERDRENKYDKYDRNAKYNRDNQYNKAIKSERDKYDRDRDSKYDKQDDYNRNDKYDKRDRYNEDEEKRSEKYNKIEKYSPSTNISIKPKSKNRIFVWDLDETLILFKSLLDGNCMEIKSQDRDLGVVAGKKIMKWIISISENYFHYNDIEEVDDPSNLSIYDDIPLDVDLRTYDFKDNINNVPSNSRLLSRLLSYRYKSIKRKYDSSLFRDNIKDIDLIDKVYDDIDNLSHQWLSFMLSLLDGVKLSGSYGKAADCVLVSAGHLIPTLAKCVIYKLNTVFTSDKVWSSSRNGKDWCFKQIKKKYGDNYDYIVVGNSNEEKIASEKNNWTFFKIIDKRSLIEFNQLYIHS